MDLDRSRLKYTDDATNILLQNSARSLHGYVAFPQNIKGIVCIGHWGRSGSGLMSSMLDNHPELIQIYPHHSLLAVYTEVLPRVEHSESVEDIVNEILERFAHVDGHPVYWTSLAEERAGIFSEVLSHHLNSQRKIGALTRRSVFLAVHAAYAFAMNCQPATNIPLIIWHSHSNNFELRRQIRNDFPEVRFIVMVRYPPRARDSSLLAFYEALPRAFPNARTLISHHSPFSISLMNLLVMGEMGRKTSNTEDIVAVRFEDLHMRTRQTMEWISHWIGIDWNESLLRSTLRGAPWGKHSMYPVYGSRYNTGTRTLSYEDYYTKSQSRIDLIKYRAYQNEFMNTWSYNAFPLFKTTRFCALNIFCYWPTRLQWRALRNFLRNPGARSRAAIISEFFHEHWKLAKEFRAEFIRKRKAIGIGAVISKAPISEVKWPGSEIKNRNVGPKWVG
jgi:hypothetical protein